jgi:hypothetical protein
MNHQLLAPQAWTTAELLAAESSGADFAGLAQYGVLGIFAAVMLVVLKGAYQREKDRSDAAYQRERDRGDRLEGEVQRLNAVIQDRVIGALTTATAAVQDSTELMTVMAREQFATGSRQRSVRGREEHS